MADATIKLYVKVDSAQAERGLKNVSRQLDNVSKSATKASTSTKRLASSSSYLHRILGPVQDALNHVSTVLGRAGVAALRTASSFSRMLGPVGAVSAVLAGVATVMGLSVATSFKLANVIASSSDKYELLTMRLQRVSSTTQEYDTTLQKMLEIANKHSTQMDSIIVLYSRLAPIMKRLKYETETMYEVIDSFTGLLRYTGLETSEVAAVTLQFSQAMQSGRLQGDEFRTVLENIPILTVAIARELNVSSKVVKQWASEGKISVDVLVRALLLLKKEGVSAAQPMFTLEAAMATLSNTVKYFHMRTQLLTQALFPVVAMLRTLSEVMLKFEEEQQGTLAQGKEQIKSFVTSAVDALTWFFDKNMRIFISLIGVFERFLTALDLLKATWSYAWNEIVAISSQVMQPLLTLFRGMFRILADAVADDFDRIVHIIANALQGLLELVASAMMKVRETWVGRRVVKESWISGIQEAMSVIEQKADVVGGKLLALRDKGDAVFVGLKDSMKKMADEALKNANKAAQEMERLTALFYEAPVSKLIRETYVKTLEEVKKKFKESRKVVGQGLMDDKVKEDLTEAQKLAKKYLDVLSLIYPEKKRLLDITKQYAEAEKILAAAFETGKISAEKYQQQLQALREARDFLLEKEQFNMLKDVLPEQERQLKELEYWYKEKKRVIASLFAKGSDEYVRYMQLLEEAYAQKQEAILNKTAEEHKKTAEEVSSLWQHAFERLSDFLAEFFRRGKFSFKEFADYIRNSLAQLFATRITTALTTPLMGVFAGSGIPGMTQQAGGSTFLPTTPGLGNLLQSGVQGLYNFFTMPETITFKLAEMFPESFLVDVHDFFAGSIGTAAGAGLMAGLTTYLTTRDWKRSLASGIGSTAGWALGNMLLPGIGGPIGGMLGGVAGGLIGGLFGKKKAPRVEFDATLVVDFVPGQGFTFSELQIDTNRKYGADQEYEQQVQEFLDTYLNKPLEWLNQIYQTVTNDLPEQLRKQIDTEFASIDFATEFSQRTHKSLGGDIDARHLAEYVRGLLKAYEEPITKAMVAELEKGKELFREAAPYLTEASKQFIVDAVEALFPEDIFAQLDAVEITKMSGEEFERWLEANIKPLFDSIEAWEQFYDWAVEYLNSVINTVTSIKQQIHDALPEIYTEDPTLTRIIESLRPAFEYVGVSIAQVQDWIEGGIYQPFTEILWNLDKYMSDLERVANATGIPIENLIQGLQYLANAAIEANNNITALAQSAAQSTFSYYGEDYSVFLARQELSAIEAKYGATDEDIRQLRYIYYRFLKSGGQEYADFINWFISTYGEQGKQDALRAIELLNQIESATASSAQTISDAFTEATTASTEIRDDLYDAADVIRSLVDDIDKKIWDLLYGQYNVELPSQKFAQAQLDYQALLAQAEAGDIDAARDLLSFVDTYLNLAQSIYKSSSTYQAIYQQVLEDLQKLREMYSGQLPSFASGGVVTAPETLAVLHGPEAVVPLSDGAIPVQFTQSPAELFETLLMQLASHFAGKTLTKEEIREAFIEALMATGNDKVNVVVQIGDEELETKILKLVDQYRVEANRRGFADTTTGVF